MENKTVTVSAFAKMAKIPKATLYNLLAGEEYKQYITEDNGVKMVSLSLLEVLSKSSTSDHTSGDRPREKKPQAPAAADGELERLRKEVAELKEKLSEKDRQIADFASRFADLASQAQLIAGQAQVLQLSEKGGIKELQAADEEQPQDQPQKKPGFLKRIFGK